MRRPVWRQTGQRKPTHLRQKRGLQDGEDGKEQEKEGQEWKEEEKEAKDTEEKLSGSLEMLYCYQNVIRPIIEEEENL